MGLSPLILDTSADNKSKRPGESILRVVNHHSRSAPTTPGSPATRLGGEEIEEGPEEEKKYPPLTTHRKRKKKTGHMCLADKRGPTGKCHRCHRRFTVTAVRFGCSTTSQKREWKNFCRVKEWKKTLRTLRRRSGRRWGSGEIDGVRREKPPVCAKYIGPHSSDGQRLRGRFNKNR